jgi:hypothetical protein
MTEYEEFWGTADMAQRWGCTEDDVRSVMEGYGGTFQRLVSGDWLLDSHDVEYIDRHAGKLIAGDHIAEAVQVLKARFLIESVA